MEAISVNKKIRFIALFLDYEYFPFFLRESRASKTRLSRMGRFSRALAFRLFYYP